MTNEEAQQYIRDAESRVQLANRLQLAMDLARSCQVAAQHLDDPDGGPFEFELVISENGQTTSIPIPGEHRLAILTMIYALTHDAEKIVRETKV